MDFLLLGHATSIPDAFIPFLVLLLFSSPLPQPIFLPLSPFGELVHFACNDF